METSLRYGKDSTALKLHAKQKLHVYGDTLLQLNGELNTKIGAPSYFSVFIRHFFPVKASVGLGCQYDRREKLRYTVRGKKAFPVTENESVNFIIKGRCEADTKFKQVGPNALCQRYVPQLCATNHIIARGDFYSIHSTAVSNGKPERSDFLVSWDILNLRLLNNGGFDKILEDASGEYPVIQGNRIFLTTPQAAAELSWSILDFQKDQSVRLKVGYDILDKIPYAQIRENNWTFNADGNGKWNVRYDL